MTTALAPIDRWESLPKRAAPARHEVLSLTARLNFAEVGGKAHTLSRIHHVGISVPAGLVITRHVFERWLDETSLRPKIERLTRTIERSEIDAQREASNAIRDLVLTTPLPKFVVDILRAIAADMLPHAPLVVRSSAVGEDGANSSFAGQLDSVLNVRTRADLQQAILVCWASYWSYRVLSYRHARRVTLAGMGVIVQRQVAAVESGVLFTRHPSGDPETMLLESCTGLADKLVSGEIEPHRRTIPRGEAARDDLACIALRLEAVLGGSQDVEWTRDASGKLWVVQSRPITSPHATSPVATEADSVVLWSNANVCENFPAPISPLLYSIASVGYYHYFRNLGLAFGFSRPLLRAVDPPLRGIIGVHGARMYYNLTNIHAVLRLAPLGEHLAASFNEFVGAKDMAKSPHPTTASNGWRRFGRFLTLARIATCTAWQYVFLRRRVEAFERTIDAFIARTRSEALAERSLAELATDLDAFMDIRCHRWKNASLADAASMVGYRLLQRMLVSAGAPSALRNRLLRALPGVPSSLPPVRLWALSRLIRADERLRLLFETETAAVIRVHIARDDAFAEFRRAFELYLDEWGFRSSAELMLTTPSPQEEPEPLFELLRQYVTHDGDAPEIVIARQATERMIETQRLLRGLAVRSPLKAAMVWAALRATQAAIVFRERARHKQAQLYAGCRRVALAIGDQLVTSGRLRARDDVFMLTWIEIEELLSGRAMFGGNVKDLVALRRRQHDALVRATPPDRIVLPWGAFLQPVEQVSERQRPAHVDTQPVRRTITGTSACGGRITACAAVLIDVSESRKLKRGDILVTRQTDPGWAPVFGLISGLVIERGGMLSHGAIIAREFGLPCVVGIERATAYIRHGDTLTIDGDAGVCTIEAISEGGAP